MRKVLLGLPVIVVFIALVTAADTSKKTGEHWEMQGDLTEACTCSVPCTCNFGEGPSPHHYCWAVFSVDIQKGHYGNVRLDGLRLAGVHGKKALVWYIDDRATSEQAAALKEIALHSLRHGHGDADSGNSSSGIHVETARIIQDVGEKGNKLLIGDKGGFEAEYIMGMDKKTPVVVENNTSWNISRSIKGKTKYLRYKDQYGNKVDMTKTNSNEGKFDWNDQSSEYF